MLHIEETILQKLPQRHMCTKEKTAEGLKSVQLTKRAAAFVDKSVHTESNNHTHQSMGGNGGNRWHEIFPTFRF